jgi:hypothetical protein
MKVMVGYENRKFKEIDMKINDDPKFSRIIKKFRHGI